MIFDKTTRITTTIAAFLFGLLSLYSIWPFYKGIEYALFPSFVEGVVLIATVLLLGLACLWASWAMYSSLNSPLFPKLSEDNLILGGIAFFGIGFTAVLQLIDFIWLSENGFVYDLSFSIIVFMGFLGFIGGRLLMNAGLNLKPHENATRHLLKRYGFIKEHKTAAKKKRK
ncbi:hypothetical protein HUU53_01180 [Candidatus Micrarchaeota archaeon]|nr:hypothetical protein [Candidatus Micrarchaeota archaeon]